MYRIINQLDQPFGFTMNNKFYFISAKDELIINDEVIEDDVLKNYPFVVEKIIETTKSNGTMNKRLNLKNNRKGG